MHADDDLRILITDKVNGLHYTKDGGDNWVKLSGEFETLTPLIGSEGFAPIEPYFIAGKDDLVLLKVRSYVGDWENRREYSKGLYYSLSGY